MRLAWILLLASCGRYDFADRGDGRGGSGRVDAVADTIVETGLVAWYRMEAIETIGMLYGIRDATGQGHDAICNPIAMGLIPIDVCPVAAPGRTGGSLAFDGSNSIATVEDRSDLHTTTAFTVTAWVELDAYAPAGGAACIATKSLGSGVFNSWAMCYLENGKFYFYTVSGSTPDELTTAATLPLAEWHHVAIRWDGAQKEILFDATVVASDADAGIDWDTMPVHIGADVDNGFSTAYAQAHIDELRIYDRALTSMELTQLAQ